MLSDALYPEGSRLVVPMPLVVNSLPDSTPEQKKEALREVLRLALVPEDRIERIVDLLDIDGTGQVYITGEAMVRLAETLNGIDSEEGAQASSLTVFRALLYEEGSAPSGAMTAITFFGIPGQVIGRRAELLQVVKAFSPEGAEVFKRVYALEDLRDGCAAVVEVAPGPGGGRLKRVLNPDDPITVESCLALAIKDGGRFDLDGAENGGVTDPAFALEGETRSRGEGSGCTAVGSFAPWLLLPLALLAAGRRR